MSACLREQLENCETNFYRIWNSVGLLKFDNFKIYSFVEIDFGQILYLTYSYEITSWLMQGMRDAIVSGSGYYHCVCTTCPENIGRVSWFSIIEF
jgi:hypothetical protein